MAYIAPSGTLHCPECKNQNYIVQIAANKLEQTISGQDPATNLLPTFYHCDNCQANFTALES
jgi:DNA-directed RNA polymerase subunit M/transcription elongation factor TFIIS